MVAKKQIVVVGGGMGGADAARRIKGNKNFDVTIVNPYEFQVYKIASLRSTVEAGDDSSKSLIPLAGACDKLVVAKVTSIDSKENKLTLSTGVDLPYDVLLLASGSQNAGPTYEGKDGSTLAEAKKYYADTKDTIAAAKKIVIIGGGPVGVELAAEIREKYSTGKSLTIVTRPNTLINTKPYPLQPGFYKSLNKQVAKRDIEVLTGATIKDLSKADFDNGCMLTGQRTLELTDGKTLDADLVFWCVGNTLNNDYIPKEWLNERGLVTVGPNLMVNGTTNVFSCGDISDVPEIKLGYLAGAQAAVAAKNMKAVATGGKPKSVYKPVKTGIMILSLGKKGGASDMMGKVVLGPWMSSMIRKDLFVSKYWKTLVHSKPQKWADRKDLVAARTNVALS